jgi:fimbrial chaperone protein
MTPVTRIRVLRCSQWLAGISLAAVCSLTAAATFSVSPVRIYMEPRERATAVTIINEGDGELVMEGELFEWRQKPDGTDELTPTDDLILAPPILKLAPRSRQVLRLANLKPVPPGEQLTYRMIVREVPEAAEPKPGVQLQVSLAFSLPIFITPPGAKNHLVCATTRKSPELLVATCENQGSAYAQAVNIAVKSASGTVLLSQDITGGYVLPNTRREFQLKQPPGGPAINGPAKVAVTQDDGSVQLFDAMLAN